jgi:DNA-binding XRE family transcriptional regulator
MAARLEYNERPLGENEFVQPPITTRVDPKLMALSSDKTVRVFRHHARFYQGREGRADEAIEAWHEVIARQARGHYWPEEIAASLAEENGLAADGLLERMAADHKDKTLVLRDRDTLAQVVPNTPFKEHWYFMYPADVNAMLERWAVPYRFTQTSGKKVPLPHCAPSVDAKLQVHPSQAPALTDEQRAEITRRLAAGETQNSLANEFGVSRKTIAKYKPLNKQPVTGVAHQMGKPVPNSVFQVGDQGLTAQSRGGRGLT